MSELTITNALIVPMTEKRAVLKGYVRIKDGTIAEIGGGSPTEKKTGGRDSRRGRLRPYARFGQRPHASISGLNTRGMG